MEESKTNDKSITQFPYIRPRREQSKGCRIGYPLCL